MATYTSNYGWTKPSGSDNVDISVLNNNLDDQDSTIHDAFLNMAPPFSESSTYAVDDIVLYGTGLYKCHTAVVTPGSWTGSTNWQVYKLSEGGSGGGGGTSDYNPLTNKPQINGVTLVGNKTTSDLGLQDELTFDNVPTDGSNNPVKSDGIYDSEKDIYAVMGKMGAKNFNSYPYFESSHTDNGVVWTDNGDGTITADETATRNSALICHSRILSHSNPLIVPNGKYILSGCPSGGTGTTYYVNAAVTKNGSSVSLGIDYGSGVEITLDGDDNYTDRVRLQISCNVRNGYTANNLTFKPMLRLASDTDDTYQPYAKTNRELTESYPADKVMMSDGVTSVEDKIGNVRMGKLWQNPSPTTDFAAQDITLSSSDYDLLLVQARYSTSYEGLCPSAIGMQGYIVFPEYSLGVKSRYRRYTANTNDKTQLGFTDAKDNGVAANNLLIPTAIYGIKLT